MTIDETIEYCRNNSDRRVSVLGHAQINCPNAYAEYFEKRNIHKSILENMIEMEWIRLNYDANPERLKKIFENREKQINGKD